MDREGTNAASLQKIGSRDASISTSFVILFYPGDDTISVVEGPSHGRRSQATKFLSRRKVPKISGGYFGVDDLLAGGIVEFYGHRFRVTGMDEYTSNHLAMEHV